MSKVFKYELEVRDHQQLSLPAYSQILSVCNQGERIVLYVMVSNSTKMKDVDIYIHGTGHTTDENATLFLGTVMMLEGSFVVHVFADATQFFCTEAAQTFQVSDI